MSNISVSQILIRFTRSLAFAIVAAVIPSFAPVSPQAFAADHCDPGSNPIVCENSKPGTPSSEWDINPNSNGDPSIQGFSTDMSVNVGDSIGFKVNTDAAAYSLLIYRMGWYGGDGARLVDTVLPSTTLPQNQPECIFDSESNFTDCGNWDLSASWDVPSDAISGVYIARLFRADTSGDSHIVFVVRDDSRTSDILFQTSDTTWQAYNPYGESSLYFGGPVGRAYKVSYNRPMHARGGTIDGRDSFFGSEYAMIRWIEKNGYDVSYMSGVDTDRMNPSLLLNHEVFLSVGHDEYWSSQQRINVEAARDAGVNLVFASGNEVYWKSRWEPSIDGNNTSRRTLVTYKETFDSAKIDPSAEWTGTWRDPRFSPPSDGGRPENSLTGTLFTVNCCTFSLRVPAEYGNLRFWRNTGVATLASGTEAVFPFGTLGYEWDEDIDNGFRPPGAFRMSSTTETAQQRLSDFGSAVEVAEATHHLMMYRAESGALIFGAGTIQWSWGLDTYHDGTSNPVDPDMQQATVNVLADMGVQPATVQNGLVTATASTDSAAPTTILSLPESGRTYTHGDVISVSGSAADTGGGVVAAVEVSLDGGNRWHPALGREIWSYNGMANSIGTQNILARAVDDSGNLGFATSVTVDVSCPCQIFVNNAVPKLESIADTTQIELGMKFQSEIDGWIVGVRFYKGPTNSGTHVGALWDTAGTLLTSGTFINETATGWQELVFPEPVAITANTTYIASYNAPNGGYSADVGGFDAYPTVSPPLQALGRLSNATNGVYSLGPASTFPFNSFKGSNYWVDISFSDIELPDTRPPLVATTTPVDGSSSVSVDSVLSVVVDESIDPSTIVFNVTDSNGSAVAGSVSYDEPSLNVLFTPSAPLANAELYDVWVSFADLAGNVITSPTVYSFRANLADGAVSSLWNDSTQPVIIDSGDANSVELGLKFIPDADLDITGVRFYKSVANTGTHIGSLWGTTGTLLAQVTFANESTTGWQQANFSTPVRVLEGITYVVSYFAPSGHYSATSGFFDSVFSNGPLIAPATSTAGGNGAYSYSTSSTFPTTGGNGANYWVAPVYEELPDTSPPVLIASSPLDGSSSVPVGTAISAVLDEPVDAPTVVVVVRNGNGELVPGNGFYDEASLTASFVPATPLVSGSQHTAEISATDLAGNSTLNPLSFSFITASDVAVAGFWDDFEVPTIVDSNDANSLEIGVKFVADTDLDIIGVRFYKSLANIGTHIGSLWDTSGELLAQVIFTDETTSGWQQATFTTPVRILEGDTYVISYFAPNGHYSATNGYYNTSHTKGPLTAPASSANNGNGVFSYVSNSTFPTSSSSSTNYWVTPVYEIPPDTTSPVIVTSMPANGESSVPLDTAVSVIFDESVDAPSIAMTLLDNGGLIVPGTLSYEEASYTATFLPSEPLIAGTDYGLEVSATDLAGNASPTPFVFAFTTASDNDIAALWNDSARPATVDSGDVSSIELGAKFVANSDLDVTGVRFYKSVTNTGTHVGSLWDAAGTQLAQVTFANETTAGWQQASFSTPVRITEGDTYVVSYFAPGGHYSATGGYFSSTYFNGALVVPAASVIGGNGVYKYSDVSTFPTSASDGTNYWVSPMYEVPADSQPPVIVSATPGDGESSVPVDAIYSVTFDEAVVAGSIELVLRDGSGTTVGGSVSYDDTTFTASFEPLAPLNADMGYSFEVSASDLAGNVVPVPLVFTFVTASDANVASLWSDSDRPAAVDSEDAASIEVGVKFVADIDLDITGVRFYKSLTNTGTHIGTLWDESGTLLDQVTFTEETTAGWQQASFSNSVRVTAGQTYIVSYFAPNGHYSATSGFFVTSHTSGPLTAIASSASNGNGVYFYSDSSVFPSTTSNGTNFWVTPVYGLPSDTTPPTVLATLPLDGSTSISVNTIISVVVDESIDPSSIAISISDSNSNSVSGAVSYDESSSTVSFLPNTSLDYAESYSVSVSVADIAGNEIATPAGFSFGTSLADGTVPALWEDSAVPDLVDAEDPNSTEVGLKFVADSDLDITGLRFYKSQTNTGTHIGSLWTESGGLLSQVTFSNESITGWQQATFSTPIRIIAGQIYVVSYFAPNGHYSTTGGYFESAYSSGPLTALASTVASGNGVYNYGSDTLFPNSSFNNANYWVTPTFQVPSDTTLPPGTGEGLWDIAEAPTADDSGDPSSIEIGVKFIADSDLDIIGLRFYKSLLNAGTHVGSLWDASGLLLARATFGAESSTGWQQIAFPTPVQIIAGEMYVVSYFAPNGHYSATGGYFSTEYSSGSLTAPASASVGGNGVYSYGNSAFPSSSFNDTNYWVTPVYGLP